MKIVIVSLTLTLATTLNCTGAEVKENWTLIRTSCPQTK
jgi:hypothetical protein